MSNFILATATLIGTIIGVGMFALPYAAARVGWGTAIVYLIILTAIVTLVHLIYGEIILRTRAKHRLVGYAEVYLGHTGKLAASIIFFITLYLALVAYLLIGGEFLSVIFSRWFSITPSTGAVIMAVVGFGIIFKGLKLTGALEFIMTTVLVALILGIFFYGAGSINISNLAPWVSGADWFLPYGVILFALSGGSAIPEIRNFFSAGGRSLKKVIVLGTVIPALVYAIFMVTVVGISGATTSPEAVTGLLPFLGENFVRYGSMVGFLAVATSFLIIGLNIKNSFNLDFGLSRGLSFALTAAVPLGLYFGGLTNFIKILSFSGAVMGGLEGLLLLAIWRRARKKSSRDPEYVLGLSPLMQAALFAILVLGIIYQFIYYG